MNGEFDAFGALIEPTEQEKKLADAPPADAVERLKGKVQDAADQQDQSRR